MICQFCKQDVESPCHDTQEMLQRAASHIDHCEEAVRRLHDMGDGVLPSDGQSGGSI